MSRRESYESNDSSKARARKLRCQSASQIARNVKSFELWASHQGCEEVAYGDIPEDMRLDVQNVFDVNARLPKEWLSATSNATMQIEAVLPAEFSDFLRKAGESAPELFTSEKPTENSKQLLCELQVVFSAWQRLIKMSSPSRKWSEADYAANVFNVIRSPAVQKGDYRAQCSIALPQPLFVSSIKAHDLRVLSAKTASPDSSIFIPAPLITCLSDNADSPYKQLKARSKGKMSVSGSIGGESDFRYQSTPCMKLPDKQRFEFASTYWEDKKHAEVEDAYRQNRMATASGVRQLHALRVNAPIFGLVWAQNTVRAHVDWWETELKTGQPVVRSAAYSSSTKNPYEWDLEDPADIVRIYLLIKNLDEWTVDGFLKRVTLGVTQLKIDVLKGAHQLVPWRRKGDLAKVIGKKVHEPKGTPRPSFSVTPASSPPKRRGRRRPRRSS